MEGSYTYLVLQFCWYGTGWI